WVTASCPNTLMSKISCRSAGAMDSTGRTLPTPATLTRALSPRPGTCDATCAAAAITLRRSVTSIITGVTLGPHSDRSLSASPGLRTVANTRQPASIICETLARPIPLEAPVITTVLFTFGSGMRKPPGESGARALARRPQEPHALGCLASQRGFRVSAATDGATLALCGDTLKRIMLEG